METDDVLQILAVLQSEGRSFWIDGGWGVDALLGYQMRPHGDLDLVILLEDIVIIERALRESGYVVAEDYLPTRAVLRSSDGKQIDLHPITFDESGTGWQRGAAPDGQDCPYPQDGFGTGSIANRAVPCLTAALQVEHHRGYEPTETDFRDMRALASAFDLILPPPYG
jgi:lincosamide nucleotidyltransferase A/C/D/E